MSADLLAVTIGIGAEHEALASEAAQRMRRFAGVDVRILGRDDLTRAGVGDPMHLKFRLFELLDAENILYFDADVFCLRAWAPQLWLNRPDWIAVRGFWFDPRVQRLGEVYGFGDETFNGGLFLINRRHHQRVLQLAQAIQPADNRFPGLRNPDEIAFSAALAALRVPLQFLDRRYNWIQFGHGNLAAQAAVIGAHACHPTLRRSYREDDSPVATALLGAEPSNAPHVGQPTQMPESSAGGVLPEFSDAFYTYDRVGYDMRPMHFRSDGTVGTGGGEAERYHFGIRHDGQCRLVIGSVHDETCTLGRDGDGVWRGRWSHHEQMPIVLTRHRAQVLVDMLSQADRRESRLVGVEVGVHLGETSAILLRSLPGLHLYMVDLWPNSSWAEHADAPPATWSAEVALAPAIVQAARGTAFAAERRTLLACDSVAAAASLPGGLDFVFIDGDHSATGVSRDLQAWRPKLAPVGLLTGHDYQHPDYPGVKAAVDAFAAKRGVRVETYADGVWHVPGPGSARLGDERTRRTAEVGRCRS